MSDSIKKYYEMVEDGLIEDSLVRRKIDHRESISLEEVELLDRAGRFGLITEIVTTALNEVRRDPKTSNLLALQIACEDWDV